MLLLVLLAAVVLAVLGTAVLPAVWAVLAAGAALLYCLDRPARGRARTALALVLVAAAATLRLGPWRVAAGSSAAVWCLLGPLAAAALLVLACGGPRRIRARHARAEAERRRVRAEQAVRARAARAAASGERRRQRRAAITRRTGLDVDLLADVTTARAGRWMRAAGVRITERLERHRPRRPAEGGPPRWLDLDHDVAADLSHRRSEEILRLAGELDRTRHDR